MQSMQKIRQAVYGIGASLLLLPAVVSAQMNLSNVGGTTSGLSNISIVTVVTRLMQWLLYLVGFLGVIAFVISGVMYLISAGDDEKIEKAKTTMIYAIVGVITALFGLILVNAVNSWLGTTSNTVF